MGVNETFEAIKNNVLAEYRSGRVVKPQSPGEFRVLFVLFRSVTLRGKVCTVAQGSLDELIFREAVRNFRYSIENMSNGAVRIVTDARGISQNLVSSETGYLAHADIAAFLAELAPAGSYDSVIAVAGGKWDYGGACSQILFEPMENNNWRKYGYAGCSIAADFDKPHVGKGYDFHLPYLLTTNYFIHEWLHQLEGYRKLLPGIIYPYTHLYYEDYKPNPAEAWMCMKNYRWNQTYFNDKRRYPHVVEPERTAVYRALLACDVDYLSERRKVGMVPGFWKLTPHLLFDRQKDSTKVIPDGSYLIRDAATRLFLTGNGNNISLSAEGTVFQFMHVGNGFYRIYYKWNGKLFFLDVKYARDSEGDPVQLQAQTVADAAQNWQTVITADSKLILRPKLSATRGLQIRQGTARLSTQFSDFTLVRQ